MQGLPHFPVLFQYEYNGIVTYVFRIKVEVNLATKSSCSPTREFLVFLRRCCCKVFYTRVRKLYEYLCLTSKLTGVHLVLAAFLLSKSEKTPDNVMPLRSNLKIEIPRAQHGNVYHWRWNAFHISYHIIRMEDTAKNADFAQGCGRFLVLDFSTTVIRVQQKLNTTTLSGG